MDLDFICKLQAKFVPFCCQNISSKHYNLFSICRYGVVLRKLDLVKEALDVFVEATHVLPLHWGTWLELCNLITDKEMVKIWR